MEYCQVLHRRIFFGLLAVFVAGLDLTMLAACQETTDENSRRRLPPESEETKLAREIKMGEIPRSIYRFEPPVRIEADGFPIQVEPPGYACPTMVDLDGDGRVDLLVGQMAGGNIQFFRNVADPGELPKFAAGQFLMKDEQRLSVPGVSCCTSATPQFVDWNQNQILDLISGNYSTDRQPFGNIWIFDGKPSDGGTAGWSWTEARILQDQNDLPLLTSSFARDTDFEQALLDGLCLHPHAVDYDGDGDLDLVVGTNGGRIFYFENLGTRQQPLFSQKPQLLSVQLPIARSAPVLVDWDGDGDLDLITGASNGGVYLSINQGSRQTPIWSDWVVLLPPPNSAEDELTSTSNSDHLLQTGHSSRVWVCDFNGNGRLDLLVGDCSRGFVPNEGIAIETFWENDKRFHERRIKLETEQSSIYHQLKGMEEREAVDAANHLEKGALERQLRETGEQLRNLWLEREAWSRPADVGHVWLYLQKGQ